RTLTSTSRTSLFCIKMFYTSYGLCSYGVEPPISGLASKIMATRLSRCDCRSLSAVILPTFSKCGGIRRERRGVAAACVIDEKNVVLSYEGLDGRVRTSALTFDPPPKVLTSSVASYAIDLEPGERYSLFATVGCDGSGRTPPAPFLRGLVSAARATKDVNANTATVETSNDLFNQILCRSMADLRMLITE